MSQLKKALEKKINKQLQKSILTTEDVRKMSIIVATRTKEKRRQEDDKARTTRY